MIVFKKKRKKGYRVKNGHRQNFTQVEIISINGKVHPEESSKKEAEAAAEKMPSNEACKRKRKQPQKKLQKRTAKRS